MAADLGVSTSTVFAAFSLALVASAVVGTRAGSATDQIGGRSVRMVTSLVFALGLAGLGAGQGLYSLLAAWVVLGVAMGCGLYAPAFAALVRLYGKDARSSITGVTLIAGFASTVGWPVTALLEASFDWRVACFVWAAAHLLVGLPLNWLTEDDSLGPDSLTTPFFSMNPVGSQGHSWQDCRNADPASAQRLFVANRTYRDARRPAWSRWRPSGGHVVTSTVAGSVRLGAAGLHHGLVLRQLRLHEGGELFGRGGGGLGHQRGHSGFQLR